MQNNKKEIMMNNEKYTQPINPRSENVDVEDAGIVEATGHTIDGELYVTAQQHSGAARIFNVKPLCADITNDGTGSLVLTARTLIVKTDDGELDIVKAIQELEAAIYTIRRVDKSPATQKIKNPIRAFDHAMSGIS